MNAKWNMGIGLLALVGLTTAGAAGSWPAVVTEDFESGYTHGNEIRLHPDWFTEASRTNPDTMNNIGCGGGWGVTQGSPIFTWVAHPFGWGTDVATGEKVIGKLDFETDGSGRYDDDRVGWMISDTDDSSNWIFAVQMDPGGSGPSGYNIECYWDSVSHGDDKGRDSICNLPALSANTYYRLIAEFTKLGAAKAGIHVELWSLDNCQPDTLLVQGDVADTSLLPNPPMADYFQGDNGTMWPAYKNYSAVGGDCDNAYFEITPEPATTVLLGFGGLALLRRRRR